MGPIGVPEMVAIFVIALLLFGPKKLPELGRTLGKAITEFRRASNELKSTFESHLSDLEREVQLEKQPDYSHTTTNSSSVTYPYTHDEYGQYSAGYDPVPDAPVEHESTSHSHSSQTESTPPAKTEESHSA
jgi:sec-independent protein translocase protein TatA